MNVAELLQFFDRRRARGESLVLATVVGTRGSTYSKTGDQMLIDADGVACGMLSGGCLEGDLAVRAGVALESGKPQLAVYELASEDDEIWGLGIGCDGSMQILLQVLSAANDYQPFTDIAAIFRGDAPAAFRIESPELGVDARFEVRPPVRLLVLGAGLDAVPLARISVGLGWRCTVADHRPAYIANPDFSRCFETRCVVPSELSQSLDLGLFDGAIVMSHHLASDREYLRELAATEIPYLGLLGPSARKDRLLADIGARGEPLCERLHGPAGLDLGGRGPDTIALSIVAEMQQVVAGR